MALRLASRTSTVGNGGRSVPRNSHPSLTGAVPSRSKRAGGLMVAPRPCRAWLGPDSSGTASGRLLSPNASNASASHAVRDNSRGWIEPSGMMMFPVRSQAQLTG